MNSATGSAMESIMVPLDSVPQPIDHVLAGADDAPALIERGAILTYREVEQAVGRLAGWLAGFGFAPGDRVATWLPKTRAACLMPLAAPRAGLVHVPINPLLSMPKAHATKPSRASMAFGRSPAINAKAKHQIATPIQVATAMSWFTY